MVTISNKLLDVAQRVLDQYYQDYAPADAFFTVDDFGYWLGKFYQKEADDVAKMIYKNSLSESGVGYLQFSQDWWKSKEYDVINANGELSVTLDVSYLGFTYDNQNSGVQLVLPSGDKGNCGSYIRTTLTEAWQLNHVTSSNIVWWYPEDNLLKFKTNKGCNPKKVKVFYIPASNDDNFDLPKSREVAIATTTWQFLMQAKQGIIIDKTNDLNPNKTIQTETDSSQLKILNG